MYSHAGIAFYTYKQKNDGDKTASQRRDQKRLATLVRIAPLRFALARDDRERHLSGASGSPAADASRTIEAAVRLPFTFLTRALLRARDALLDVGLELFAGEFLVLALLPALVRCGKVGPRFGEAIGDGRLAVVPFETLRLGVGVALRAGLLGRRLGVGSGHCCRSARRRRWRRRWGVCRLRDSGRAGEAEQKGSYDQAFHGAFLDPSRFRGRRCATRRINCARVAECGLNGRRSKRGGQFPACRDAPPEATVTAYLPQEFEHVQR